MNLIDYKVVKHHNNSLELFLKIDGKYTSVYCASMWDNRQEQLRLIRETLNNILIAKGNLDVDVYEGRLEV